MPHRLPVAVRRAAWVRFGSAIGLVAVAAGLTWLIDPIRDRTPFMLFFAAVVITAVTSGVGPAALAIASSCLIVTADLLDPSGWVQQRDLVNNLGFIAVCAVIVALAERAQRHARVERAQREWLDVTLRSIGDGVIVTNAKAEVLAMNSVAEDMTGWSEAEGIGQPVDKVFAIENQFTRAPVENPIDRVVREGRIVGLANHTVLVRRDGKETPIDDSGAPILSEDGRVVGTVLVFRDITERYASEKERSALLERERQARTEAETANRTKDEFLAVLSHELRTPLNAIRGWAQLLLGGNTDARRAAEVIDRNAVRQAKLIDDVLDVSRIVSGNLNFERYYVDIGRVIDAAIESIRPFAEKKKLQLDAEGIRHGPVLGDEYRLQQVLENLLSNAVKFTPQGGAVTVSLEREGLEYVIAVRDTGEGISPAFLPHVFERFRQEDARVSRRHGGLGLGLTIVTHLVTMHGGSVKAQSDGPGLGSTFSVRLPALSEAISIESRSPRPSQTLHLSGIRVLVVDDDADSLELMRQLLAGAGADVSTSRSAGEALSRLSDFAAQVLVADIAMPNEDGFSLLLHVRERGYGMPAIAVTAFSSAEERLRALEAGFAEHVSKPVDANELLLVVGRAAIASEALHD
jgi:PAS domain S-box-containing protein